MRRMLVLGGGLWVLLVVSLAFNIGFGSTLAVHKVREVRAGPCGDGDGTGVCERRLFGVLNLSGEQARQLEQTQADLQARIAALRADLEVERGRLGTLLAADEPDEPAIAAQLDRIAAVQRQVQESVVAHLLAVRGHLSEQQRAEFNTVIRERICPCDGGGPGGRPCEMHDGEADACPRAEQR